MKRRHSLARALVVLGAGLLILVYAGCGSSSSSSSAGGEAKSTATVAQNATAASNPNAPRSQSVTIARSSDATGFDPQDLEIGEDYSTQEAIYASLVRPSADGTKIEGDLASSYTYDPSSLTYAFQLRPGLKFSDGTPLRAADIVFSVKFAQQGPVYAPMLAAISSVSAPSPAEIKVKLSKYSSLVLPALSFAFIVPNNLKGEKPTKFFKQPVSSGAFVVSSWEPNDKMVLKRNPYYWNQDFPRSNEIVFQIIPEESARLNSLEAGNIQLDEYVPDEQVPALSSSQLVENKPRASLVLLMTNNARAPFSSASTRKAAALAINRALLLKTIWHGAGLPTQGLIPPGLQESHPTPSGSDAWAYNPTEAKALLHGQHPSITLLASDERGIDSSLVQAIQQELTQVGFHVTSQVRDYATAVNQVLSGDFSIFLTPQTGYLPTIGEPLTTYATLFSPAGHWDQKAIEGYLQQLQAASTQKQREAVGQAFERYGHATSTANPIGNPYIYFGVSNELRGLQLTPFGTYRLEDLQLEK